MSAFSATDNQRRARFFVFKCIKIKHSFTINQHLLIHSTARTQMSSPDQSFFIYLSERFYIYLEQLVYPEAVVECRRKGLVMAKVESEAENE